MALLLNRRIRGRAFLRTLAFAPFVLPHATTAVMWLLLLQPGGFVDQIMKAVGLGGLVQLWLANLHLVLYTMIVVPHLAVLRLCDDLDAGRPAGHPQRAA